MLLVPQNSGSPGLVHEPDEAIHRVIHVAKRPRLRAVAVDGDILTDGLCCFGRAFGVRFALTDELYLCSKAATATELLSDTGLAVQLPHEPHYREQG